MDVTLFACRGYGADCCCLALPCWLDASFVSMYLTSQSPPQRRKRLKLPAPHRQQQRVAFAVFGCQLLIGLVLLRKVLRHALHTVQKGRCEAAADRAMNQQQALAVALKSA